MNEDLENLNLNKDTKIEEVLQEFEVKNPEQKQQDQDNPSVFTVEKKYVAPEVSKMSKLIMKISGGAIKEQKQAEYVLMVFAIIFFTASMFFFFRGSFNKSIENKGIDQVTPLETDLIK